MRRAEAPDMPFCPTPRSPCFCIVTLESVGDRVGSCRLIDLPDRLPWLLMKLVIAMVLAGYKPRGVTGLRI